MLSRGSFGGLVVALACARQPEPSAATVEVSRAAIDGRQVAVAETKETFATTLAVGSRHVCAIGSDHAVYCWGENDEGQLGNDSRTASAQPVRVVGVEQAYAVASGLHFSCALHGDQQLTCWGKHPLLSLTSRSREPTLAGGAPSFTQIAAGYRYVCGIDSGRRVHCLGAHGMNGHSLLRASRRWTRVAGLENAAQLVGSTFGSCVRKSDHSVWCWGLMTTQRKAPQSPVRIRGVHATRLGISWGELPCAETRDGEAWCWDRDGLHRPSGKASPGGLRYPVTLIADQTELSVGTGFACARNANGVFCEGTTFTAAMGIDPPPFVSQPRPVDALAVVSNLSAGGSRTCGKTSTGITSCVDFINDGIAQLPHAAPFAASAISAGCVREGTGVTCVGNNWRGALGIAPSNSSSNDASRVHHQGMPNVVALAHSLTHSCALESTGKVICWGDNSSQQIDPSRAEPWLPPTKLTGLPHAVDVGVGTNGFCILDRSGRVHCRGKGGSSLLAGDGLDGATRIDISGGNGCASTKDRRMKCWGHGPPHARTTGTSVTPRADPTDIGLSEVVEFGLGFGHACALDSGGTVSCWGSGQSGQVGQGLPRDEDAPVRVFDGANDLAVASWHTCATRSDGSLWCWGVGIPGSGPHELKDAHRVPVP